MQVEYLGVWVDYQKSLVEKAKYKRKKVIVVSQDINMRVKCDSLGLLCEDYIAHDTVENKDEVFTGLTKYLVDEQVVDSFYAGEKIYADEDEIKFNYDDGYEKYSYKKTFEGILVKAPDWLQIVHFSQVFPIECLTSNSPSH